MYKLYIDYSCQTNKQTKMGWIYVITCDMYDKDNLKKIGFTEKIGLLEEEVRTSLIQRYGTTLMSPKILYLIKEEW